MGSIMAKKVLIGRIAFNTQGEAMDFVRAILDKAEWGVPLTGDDHEFVLSLLERHPNASKKIGCGVSYFTVNSDGQGSRCFYVHRSDGSSDHFSYVQSVKAKNDIRSLVVGALNRAVDTQIWQFRDEQLKNASLVCPYTGNAITKDSYHVDHYEPTFLELYTAWMKEQGLRFADIAISDGSANEIGRRMVDDVQLASWQKFHRDNARLRMLSPLANLSNAKIEANRRIRQAAEQNGAGM